MDKSLFHYIWTHSKRDQILICAVVLASLPLYFASLDLPRRIVNEAIQGRAFRDGALSANFLPLHVPLPDWLGGTRHLFDGFAVDRFGLLFGLSGLFLVLVLVNGAFKYWINLAKGALGERMLRRMRFELFSLTLRFTPEAQRQVKASEVATIVKDEVEPIGGFIGDAFILPAFLGTQAATALVFILLQSFWLGIMAALVVGVQFVVIPRLRRELLRLGRRRQLASRRLAGRVGEVVDGMEAVHVYGAESWERAELGQRLFELFDLRLRIYRRKFMVKFLNNLLAQLTPFFFYAIGGYFALKGRLDIGQLVAVIAAYRDLPPPLKELIDWDQQRLDVQVKYDQVVQQFAPERLLPEHAPRPAPRDDERAAPGGDDPAAGDLAARDLVVEDLVVAGAEGHGPVIAGATLRHALPARIAVLGDGGPAASALAQVLGGRRREYGGRVAVAGLDLAAGEAALAGHVIYAGLEPTLFPGSLRDNVVYGLRRPPPAATRPDDPAAALEEERRVAEAHRTGNPVDDVSGSWLDFARAGVADADALDARLLVMLRAVGMGPDLYRFGLSGTVDPAREPAFAADLVEARARLREHLVAEGMADLVEPFDETRFNRQATLAENLLFGVPTDRALMGRALAGHAALKAALEPDPALADALARGGATVAATMTEIFRDLPPGHPLFEQFSFLSADELPEYEALLKRHGWLPAGYGEDGGGEGKRDGKRGGGGDGLADLGGALDGIDDAGMARAGEADEEEAAGVGLRRRLARAARVVRRFVHSDAGLAPGEEASRARAGEPLGRLSEADRTRLVGLILAYVEPRHRLDILDDALRAKVVEARPRLRAALEAQAAARGDRGAAEVAFYDADMLCAAAPLRDNLLFGRVQAGAAEAASRIAAAMTAVVDELGLAPGIARVGLDHQVGPAGRLLTAAQRSSVALVRALVRRPDLLVLDGALTALGEVRAVAAVAELTRAPSATPARPGADRTGDAPPRASGEGGGEDPLFVGSLVAVIPHARVLDAVAGAGGAFDALVRAAGASLDLEELAPRRGERADAPSNAPSGAETERRAIAREAGREIERGADATAEAATEAANETAERVAQGRAETTADEAGAGRGAPSGYAAAPAPRREAARTEREEV